MLWVFLQPARAHPHTSLWGYLSLLLVFLLGMCRYFPCLLPTSPQLLQPQHISVICVFWQLRGLGMIWNLCGQPEPLCPGRFGGGISQVPLEPLLPVVILRGSLPT